MSVHVTSAVWRTSKAAGNGLLVLLSLADQASDEGWCWPSVASIARRCRLSPRTVQGHLAELIELGELERHERSGRSSHFRVLLGLEAGPSEVPDPVDNLAGPVDNPGGEVIHSPADSAGGGARARRGGVRGLAPRIVSETSEIPRGRAARSAGADAARRQARLAAVVITPPARLADDPVAEQAWLIRARRWVALGRDLATLPDQA